MAIGLDKILEKHAKGDDSGIVKKLQKYLVTFIAEEEINSPKDKNETVSFADARKLQTREILESRKSKSDGLYEESEEKVIFKETMELVKDTIVVDPEEKIESGQNVSVPTPQEFLNIYRAVLDEKEEAKMNNKLRDAFLNSESIKQNLEPDEETGKNFLMTQFTGDEGFSAYLARHYERADRQIGTVPELETRLIGELGGYVKKLDVAYNELPDISRTITHRTLDYDISKDHRETQDSKNYEKLSNFLVLLEEVKERKDALRFLIEQQSEIGKKEEHVVGRYIAVAAKDSTDYVLKVAKKKAKEEMKSILIALMQNGAKKLALNAAGWKMVGIASAAAHMLT